MHYQLMPSAEVKVVRCISGALYDVILDLRPDSATFGQWFGETLSAENRLMMYCPKGFAHGFGLFMKFRRYAPDHPRHWLRIQRDESG